MFPKLQVVLRPTARKASRSRISGFATSTVSVGSHLDNAPENRATLEAFTVLAEADIRVRRSIGQTGLSPALPTALHTQQRVQRLDFVRFAENLLQVGRADVHGF
ncbi:MAG: hypothetical protein QNJ44_09185 [Rhodobacter sp.]|nr:hypothetical protein [Rhodobacter sp.]